MKKLAYGHTGFGDFMMAMTLNALELEASIMHRIVKRSKTAMNIMFTSLVNTVACIRPFDRNAKQDSEAGKLKDG